MIELLKSHTSVRRYKDEAITDQVFHELLGAAQHAATSHFVQAYSVIRVSDPVKKENLGKFSKNPLQFETAALSLVFCADLNRLNKATQMQDMEMETGTVENFIVSIVDTALFAQNFVIAAESKGYGISFIGGVRNNPEKISEMLDIPDHVLPLFGMTVGVPAEANEVKPRLPIEAILHEDAYDESKYNDLLEAYDVQMCDYYNQRLTNKKNHNWTGGMARYLSVARRPYMKDFVLSKGFMNK